jgi:hypothetical protein
LPQLWLAVLPSATLAQLDRRLGLVAFLGRLQCKASAPALAGKKAEAPGPTNC